MINLSVWTKYHKNGDKVSNGWVCDECDRRSYLPTPYCPYCGKRIKGKIKEPKMNSVDDFIESSDWNDWIDEYTQDVYTIYWKWCVKEDLTPEPKVVFMRKVLTEYPELKSVPYKGKRKFKRM